MDLEADIYLYKYSCPRWYGYHDGLKNMIVNKDMSEKEVIKLASEKANFDSGSKSCDIFLLQQFNAVIKSGQSYSDLVSIPFDTANGLEKMLSRKEAEKAELQSK